MIESGVRRTSDGYTSRYDLYLSRMRPVTTRIPDDTYGTLEEIADERDESVSAVVRDLVEQGLDYDDLERENQRLQNRVRKLIDTREEHDELVEYVEEERLDRQRERGRREQRRSAPAWRRAKWWLLGTPDDE